MCQIFSTFYFCNNNNVCGLPTLCQELCEFTKMNETQVLTSKNWEFEEVDSSRKKEFTAGILWELPGIHSALKCGKADITHENQRFMCKTMNEAGLFATRGADLSPRGTLMETLRTSILESTISLLLWKAGCDRIWFRKERKWRIWQHCLRQTHS